MEEYGKQYQCTIIDILKELKTFLETKGFKRLEEMEKANPSYTDKLTKIYVDCLEEVIKSLAENI